MSARLFVASIEIYPASVKPSQYRVGYDWNTLLVDLTPVITEEVRILQLIDDFDSDELCNAIRKLIRDKMMEIGKDALYSHCPLQPGEE